MITKEQHEWCVKNYGPNFDKPVRNMVEVFNEYGDEEWSVGDFLKEISEVATKIPDGCPAKVKLYGGYDEVASLEIYYWKTETQDEVNQRIEGYLKSYEKQIDWERQHYEQLKKKFSNG